MRWKGFITLIVILAVVVGVGAFILDDVIEISVEKIGTTVWGAKIEIDDIILSWSPLAMEIKKLTVASKSDEYRNLVDIGKMKFAILVLPLLEKKINIEEVSGTQLAFNTERKTSGFLPETRKERRKEIQEKWKDNMSAWIEDIKKRALEKIDVTKGFDYKDLEALKAINGTTEYFEEVKLKYREFKGLDPQSHVKQAEESIKELQAIKVENETDIPTATKKIEQAARAVKDVDEFISEVQKHITEFNGSISGLQKKINGIDRARKEDYLRVMDRLKIPSIEVEDIARTVFGPLVTDRFGTVISYVKKIREHVPPKPDKEKAVKKPRKQGADIMFFREKSYPQILVKKGMISGADNASISISGLTTTPWVYGKPAVVEGEYKDLNFKVSIDRSGKQPSEYFSVGDKSFKISDGIGALKAQARFKGQEIVSDITWKGRGLLPQNWLDYIELKNPLVSLSVRVTGNMDSPVFSMRSNLDEIISGQLKKVLQKKLAQAQKEVKKLVDAQVLDKKKDIEAQIESFKSQKQAQLNEYKQMVENEKIKLEGEKSKKEQELKQVIEDKTKKAQEKLKDIFKLK